MTFWKRIWKPSALPSCLGIALAFAVTACNPSGDTTIGTNFYPGVTLSLQNSTVSVSNSQVLSGNSLLVRVSLQDTSGNPFVSTEPVVNLQTNGGASTGAFSAVINNGDGTYSSTFSALTAGSATTIQAVVDGSILTSTLPTVAVLSGNFSLAQSLLSVSSGSVMSGSQVTVTLTVKDSLGNPSTSGGLTVTFFNSGGTSTGAFSPTTDHQDGTYTSSFTGGLGGTATVIYATIQGNSVTSALPTLTVIDIAPSSLTYSANPALYTKGTTITPNSPSHAGGPINSYTISPALPAGLTFDGGSGIISGTPTTLTSATNYTVTAVNTGGTTTATVSLTVNDVAPSTLTYSSNSAIYTKGSAITNNSPTNSGGSVLSYGINPALPNGLNFSIMTGIISGTPTAVSAATNYTVIAANSGGSTTATLSLSVIDLAPSNLTYTVNSPVYSKNVAISSNSPTSAGGAITSYSISPSLPSGLSLNTSTGVITGNPSSVSAAALYTVTATNSGGSITASLTISVQDTSPSGLTYSSNPVTFTKGSAASDSPSNSGGAVTSYSVSPSLPNGLAINTTTGVISGTPTASTSAANYTVTATNTGGSTTASVSITINDIAPSALSYSTNPAVYTKNSAIITNSPANSGGSVVSYSVSPALPAGLALNTGTGVITGTATTISSATSYTVTAINTGGSTTVNVSITVNDIPPSTLTYGTNPATYTKGVAIATNVTSNSGGVITSYSVSPSLPAGLSLNTSTGSVTGTPTAITENTTYTVTGVNSGANVTASLIITVNDAAPTALTYVSTNPVYTKNSSISADTVTNSGGAATSYSVSPSLPLGLSLDTSAGTISGTPTSVTASANYTVTALNTGGSTTAILTITVNDAAPSALTYASTSPTYTKGLAITNDTVTNSGGAVVSYAVSPALPAGLSLSTSTGAISGTPTAVSATTNYTITATNTGGSTTAILSMTVNDVVASNLVYSGDPAVYTKGTAITNNMPTNSGGSVTGYSVSPALPAGLTLNTSTGVISGTPTAVTATANYTITATNSGGSVADSVSLTVNDVTPSALTYSANPVTYTRGTAITNNTPTVSGGAITSYSVSPSLPGGLSLNTTTGVISGNPTIYTATASYVVTATNSGGNTTASVSILVKDVPLLSYNGAIGTAGTVGTAMSVTPTTFSTQGAAITGCAVKASTTALPTWATINPSTCVITGTPTGALASTTYTIDATNSAGTSTDATVSLSAVYPVPTLTSITPSTGTRNGGTSVTIAGTGFYSGITVTLGGTACASMTVTSTTQITCATPAHVIGAVDVVVTNPGTTSATLSSGFTFTSVAYTQNWDFNTASQYNYDSTKIDFTGGVAELTASSQTDNSSNCTTGFGDGVTASCGGTSTGIIWSTATDGLGSSNYMMLSHAGTATDLELDSTWTPAWSNLVGYWKLNESAGATSVTDSSPVGTHSGTPSTGVSLGAAGKLNTAASFNGSAGSGIVTPSTLEVGAGDFTLAAWVKSTQAAASGLYPFIAGKDTVTTSPRVAYELIQSSQTTNLPYFAVAVSGTFYYIYATKAINDGIWHHVVGVRAGTTLNIYLDGSLSASSTNAAVSGNVSNSSNFTIGGDVASNVQYNGTIDDVAVWSTALSASAVAMIYQHESAAHAGTFKSRVMDGLSANSWTSLAATTTLPYGKELPDANPSPSPTTSPTPESESSSSYSSLPSTQPLMQNLVGLWHLDEASGSSVYDTSGYGNTGSVKSGITLGAGAKQGTGAYFSGTSTSYITLNSAINLTGDFTISFWANFSGTITNNQVPFTSSNTSLNFYDGYFRVWNGSTNYAISSVQTTAGLWHHYVARRSGSGINNVTTYIDGKLVATSTSAYSGTFAINAFGQPTAGVGYTTGLLDELAVWNRALGDVHNSSNEILALYRRGANRIRYQVRSCADSTCSTNPTWIGPDGSNQTYFSELNNNLVPKDGGDLSTNDSVNAGNPTFTFANFVTPSPSPSAVSVPTNRYFQYRTIMESDDTSTSCNYGGSYTAAWCSPELQSVIVGPTHYDTSAPTVSNVTGVSYATLTTTFTPTTSCSSNTLYNLSPDGTNWYYYSGGVWSLADGTTAKATLGGSINAAALTAFTTQYGAGNAFFRVFLQTNTSGTNSCSIDNLTLGMTQ